MHTRTSAGHPAPSGPTKDATFFTRAPTPLDHYHTDSTSSTAEASSSLSFSTSNDITSSSFATSNASSRRPSLSVVAARRKSSRATPYSLVKPNPYDSGSNAGSDVEGRYSGHEDEDDDGYSSSCPSRSQSFSGAMPINSTPPSISPSSFARSDYPFPDAHTASYTPITVAGAHTTTVSPFALANPPFATPAATSDPGVGIIPDYGAMGTNNPNAWMYNYSHSRSSSVSSAASTNTSKSNSTTWSDMDPNVQGMTGEHHFHSHTVHRNQDVYDPYTAHHMHQLNLGGPAHQHQHQHQHPQTVNLHFLSQNPYLHQQAHAPSFTTLPLQAHQPSSSSVSPIEHPSVNPFLGQTVATQLDPRLINYANAIRSAQGSNHSTEKAKTNFVHSWLASSFHLHPEGNVSRQALYASYIHVCGEYGIQPINAASYGKAVRSCWPGIKTRRLGVRGASRYHYCGIRPANAKVEELINHVTANETTSGHLAGEADGMNGAGNGDSEHGQVHVGSQHQGQTITIPFPTVASQTISPNLAGSSFDSHVDPADPSKLNRQASSSSLNQTIENEAMGGLSASGSTSIESNSSSDIIPDFNMADVKTPTALQFLQNTNNTLHSQVYASQGSTTATGSSSNNGNLVPSALEARRKGSDSQIVGRSRLVSGGSNSMLPESFGLRSGNRRATLPDLSISIPPIHRSAASAQPVGSVRMSEDCRKSAVKEEPNGMILNALMLPPSLSIILPNFKELIASFSPAVTNSRATSGTGAPSLEGLGLGPNFDRDSAELLWNTYRSEHCLGLLKIVAQGRWDEFAAAVLLFWSQLDDSQQQLVQHPVLNDSMYKADSLVYNAILSFLSETIFNEPVDSKVCQQLRTVAQNFEQYIVDSLHSFPAGFVGCRVELASRTAHLISRHLGVVQLAQNLDGVLTNPSSVTAMVGAWEEIDFEMIANQAALVTNATHDLVNHYQNAFKEVLARLNALSASEDATAKEAYTSVKLVAEFASGALAYAFAYVQDRFAKGHLPIGSKRLGPRSFLLMWNYVTGQVLRDLAIKGDAALSNFQMLSVFVEEWLAYRVLKDVALHVAAVQASVAAQSSSQGTANTTSRQFFNDTSAYLVSPRTANGFDTTLNPKREDSDGPLSSPPPNDEEGRGVPQMLASSSGLTGLPSAMMGGPLPTPSMNFNFLNTLSPTTRMIFGDAKTPVFLNFNHFPPPTPVSFGFTAFSSPASQNQSQVTPSSTMSMQP